MKKETKGQIFLKIFTVIIFLSFIIFPTFFQKDITVLSKGQNADIGLVSIGHSSIKVFLANDWLTREKGLGGIDRILPDEGILFIFDYSDRYGIWMKDMRFPIDIFWLAPANFPEEKSLGTDEVMLKVVDIRENVSPATFPEVFTPKASAKYVLETHAGFARENNVKIGNQVSF